MLLDNFTADAVEILLDKKTPNGCIRIHWSAVDENNDIKRGSVDLTIVQNKEVSLITGDRYILVENEFDENEEITKDFVRYLLNSLADKIIFD